MVEPDGRVVTYAELASGADRYGCGLQVLGPLPEAAIARGSPQPAAVPFQSRLRQPIGPFPRSGE